MTESSHTASVKEVKELVSQKYFGACPSALRNNQAGLILSLERIIAKAKTRGYSKQISYCLSVARDGDSSYCFLWIASSGSSSHSSHFYRITLSSHLPFHFQASTSWSIMNHCHLSSGTFHRGSFAPFVQCKSEVGIILVLIVLFKGRHCSLISLKVNLRVIKTWEIDDTEELKFKDVHKNKPQLL